MSTVKTTRIENSVGDGVDVAGLGKIEDTGKNICTAWVVFDGTTTPPTIKDSFNVDSVDRTSTGIYDINYSIAMDSVDHCVDVAGPPRGTEAQTQFYNVISTALDKTTVAHYYNGAFFNANLFHVHVFGGKA